MCMYTEALAHVGAPKLSIHDTSKTKHTLPGCISIYNIYIYTSEWLDSLYVWCFFFFFGCPCVFVAPKQSSGLGLCSLDVHWFNGVVSPGHAGRQVSWGVQLGMSWVFPPKKRPDLPAFFFPNWREWNIQWASFAVVICRYMCRHYGKLSSWV